MPSKMVTVIQQGNSLFTFNVAFTDVLTNWLSCGYIYIFKRKKKLNEEDIGCSRRHVSIRKLDLHVDSRGKPTVGCEQSSAVIFDKILGKLNLHMRLHVSN